MGLVDYPAKGRTLLSPSDVAHLGISRRMLYVYRRSPDCSTLREGLSSLVRENPDIAGRIGKCEDNNFYILRNFAGVEFSVEDLDTPMPNYGVDRHIDDRDVNKDIRSVFQNLMDIEGPLVRFRMTRFSCGGATLSMELSHALTDGIGRGLLLTHWARLCRNQIPPGPLDHNRTTLVELAINNEDLDGDGEEIVQMTLSDLMGWLDKWHHGPDVYAVVKVSSAAVSALRESCAELMPDQHISRQDVMTAKLWQIYSSVQQTKSRGRLINVLDFRGKANIGIGKDYFGNAVTFARVDYDINETRHAPIAALALRLRRGNEQALTFNKVSHEQSVWWRNRYLKEQGLVAITRRDLDALESGQLNINNLSRFPVRELDFGTGPPFWVAGIKQLLSPSFGVFPLSSPDEDGYALHVNLCEREMQCFLDIVDADPFFGTTTVPNA